jgi:putative alpha-1,2-mannosidase
MAFDSRSSETSTVWRQHLNKIKIEISSDARQTIFSTALYHSLIKPCFAPGESPMWPTDGPFVFDICTMWDIYRTQLPLITALFPSRAVELANALLTICEEEGNLPIGYRMAKGADRFSRQGSALAHTFMADLCELGMPGIDWDWALCHMDTDLRRSYGEDYLLRGLAEPITHTLDLALGYQCTATVARYVGDNQLAAQFEALASQWVNAFNPVDGLLVDSTYYEGGKWNYSFRLLHDKQLGELPSAADLAAGYALNRFEGLNNEPDMEAPWAYHYAGRPDRTAEVVHAAVNNMFGLGRGGLPGNDDSGGLSSWYVWASLGLFPIAGQSLYLINAPSFAESRIAFAEKDLLIDAAGFVEPSAGGPVQYVQNAIFNGEVLDRTWLTARELHRGGHLELQLGPMPSAWGTATRPPSASQPDATSPPATAATPARPNTTDPHR